VRVCVVYLVVNSVSTFVCLEQVAHAAEIDVGELGKMLQC
jgi:hypothetical protein